MANPIVGQLADLALAVPLLPGFAHQRLQLGPALVINGEASLLKPADAPGMAEPPSLGGALGSQSRRPNSLGLRR